MRVLPKGPAEGNRNTEYGIRVGRPARLPPVFHIPYSVFLVRVWPWLLAAVFAAGLSLMAIRRFEAMAVFSADLAVYDQIIWNTAQGRPFASSLLSWFATSSLGDHVNPILLLLVPLYWVWPDPRGLLVAQALALSVGVIPVAWWAGERLGSSLASTAVVIAYFVFPPLAYIGLFEFHEITLAVPLLGFGTYYLLRRRPLPFAVLVLLSLLVKEEMAFVVLGLGLYALFAGWRRLGALIVAAAVGWGWLALGVIMPANTVWDTSWFAHRYAYLGDSPGQMLLTIVRRPFYVLQQLLTTARLEFLTQFFAPLGFLPALGWPLLLLMLPTLAYHLLSENPAQYSIRFHYTTLLLPFAFLALVQALALLRRWLSWRILVPYLLGTSAVGAFLLSPLPFGQQFRAEEYRLTPRTALGRQLVAAVPPAVPVAADRTLVGHLAQRTAVYEYPHLANAQYVLVDFVGSKRPAWWRQRGQFLNTLLADPAYQIDYRGYGFAVLRRGAGEQRPGGGRLDVRLGDDLVLRRYELQPGRLVQPGTEVTVALEWEVLGEIDEAYVTFVHLVDRQGRRWAQRDSEPWEGNLPLGSWPANRPLVDPYRLLVPTDAPAGEYQVVVGLYDPLTQQRVPVTAPTAVPFPDAVVLGPLRVEPARRGAAGAGSWREARATFAGRISLEQYKVDGAPLAPGGLFEVVLRWRTAGVAQNYTLFVHLIAPDGAVMAQQDSQPAYGYRPTSRWQAETEETVSVLQLPSQMPPGTYKLEVGWYNLATMERLPVVVDGAAATAVSLAEVQVAASAE